MVWTQQKQKILRRGGKNTQKNCTKKIFTTQITQLEPDNLECEVKWALGSITTEKASGCDGISVEPFHILKDDDVKVLYSICYIQKCESATLNFPANLENSAVATGLEKVSFHSNL